MELKGFAPEVKREILRLSLEIAILKYDYREQINEGVPPSLCSEMASKLASLEVQKYALLTGRYNELPYHINLIYNEKTNKKT